MKEGKLVKGVNFKKRWVLLEVGGECLGCLNLSYRL